MTKTMAGLLIVFFVIACPTNVRALEVGWSIGACSGPTAFFDIASDLYWDGIHICTMKVQSLREDDKPTVTLATIHPFSGGDCPSEIAVRADNFCCGNGYSYLNLAIGDSVIAFFWNPSCVYVAKLDETPWVSRLLRRVTTIAALRNNEGGLQALSEGVFDADPGISTYCLKRMMGRYPPNKDEYVTRLCKLRDTPGTLEEAQEDEDPKIPYFRAREIEWRTESRILACQLIEYLQNPRFYSNQSDSEYEWLCKAITSSRYESRQQLQYFVDALLKYRDRQTIVFLSRLAADPSKRSDLRISAADGLEMHRVRDYHVPDDCVPIIWGTYMQMLLDDDSKIRDQGAFHIHNMSRRIVGSAGSATPLYLLSVDLILQLTLWREHDPQLQHQIAECEEEVRQLEREIF